MGPPKEDPPLQNFATLPPMGKPKAQVAKGDDASNLVLSYLRKTNRPYSVTDIANNLHNAVTKSALQKVLQQLVEAGGVQCKTQGKQSIYVIRQDDNESPTKAELAEMDNQMASLKLQISTSKEKIKQFTSQYTALSGSLQTSDLQASIAAAEKEIASLDDKLAPLKDGTLALTSEFERQQIQSDLAKVKKMYHTRRKIFKEMTGMYIDAFGKAAYETLVDKLGLEDDSEEFCRLLRREGQVSRF